MKIHIADIFCCPTLVATGFDEILISLEPEPCRVALCGLLVLQWTANSLMDWFMTLRGLLRMNEPPAVQPERDYSMILSKEHSSFSSVRSHMLHRIA